MTFTTCVIVLQSKWNTNIILDLHTRAIAYNHIFAENYIPDGHNLVLIFSNTFLCYDLERKELPSTMITLFTNCTIVENQGI